MDGQAQVVVAVFEEQDVGLVNQPPPKLPFHLHYLLQREKKRGVNSQRKHILLSQALKQMNLWIKNTSARFSFTREKHFLNTHILPIHSMRMRQRYSTS